jgi:hypothetical protein
MLRSRDGNDEQMRHPRPNLMRMSILICKGLATKWPAVHMQVLEGEEKVTVRPN